MPHTTPTSYASTSATSDLVWISWNSTATTSFVLADPWPTWCATTNNITVTSSTAINQTWSVWAARPQPVAYKPPAPPTAEELAAQERRRVEAELREAQRREQRRVAIGKADKLLESVLNDVQREHLKRSDAFLVRGQSGQLYRIRKGRHINVDKIGEGGEVLGTLCAHPFMDVPDGDTMVAQKLMLECDEQEFLRIANRHSPRGPRVESEAIRAMLARV